MKDTKGKCFDRTTGKRIFTHTGKLNPSRKAGRTRNPNWASRSPRPKIEKVKR
jgi:hypothetical protein